MSRILLRYAVIFLAIKFLFYNEFAITNNLAHNVFRGLLKPNITLLTTAIYSITISVSTILLANNYKMDGVYLGNILAWITEFIICVALFIFTIKNIKLKEKINYDNK